MQPKTRLYVEAELATGKTLELERNQSHHLANVLRAAKGDRLLLFNGRDGEWCAKVSSLRKKAVTLTVQQKEREQIAKADLWLLFAPIKKGRLDYMVEKSVELGVGKLCPVSTERTAVRTIKPEKLAAHTRHAAEQCGALAVPSIEPMKALGDLLGDWPVSRQLIYCDEYGEALSMAAFLSGLSESRRTSPWAILIGPEGGFSERERRLLRGSDFVTAVSLGPLVLRADTAAVTAIALWQSLVGQWVSE